MVQTQKQSNLEKDGYQQYKSLTEPQRKALVSTNYFRILNGEKPIDVPPEDNQFWNYWKHPKDCSSIGPYNVYQFRVKNGIIKPQDFPAKTK